MKKKIIAIVAIILVVAIGAGVIYLATAKESKQMTKDNLNLFYDVTVEITDYKPGEKTTFFGILPTYTSSRAKVHVVVTPKSDVTCDGGALVYNLDASPWGLVNEKKYVNKDYNELRVNLNAEGATEVYIDIEADVKLKPAEAPDADDVVLTAAYGTVTYKKFFK